MLTVEVLERFPEALERWQKTFRYILVDEYQDTNHAQYRLLQLLAGGTRTSSPSAIPTSRSTRSAAPTSATCSSSSTTSTARGRSRSSRTTARRTGSSARRTRSSRTTASGSRRTSGRELGDGEPVRVLEVEDEHAEARFIAAEIARLHDEGWNSSRDRDLLPDERAVPRGRGHPRPPGRAVPGDRRPALLRAGRGEGRGRLPPGDRQPGRRGLARADREPAAARAWGTRRSLGSPPSPTRRGSRSARRSGAPTRRASGRRRCAPSRKLARAARLARRRGAGALRARSARARPRGQSGYLEALEAERTVEAQGRIENLEELLGVAREYDGDGRGADALGLPPAGISLVSDQDAARRRGRQGHADDAPQREGPRVPRRLPRSGWRRASSRTRARSRRATSRRSGGSRTSASRGRRSGWRSRTRRPARSRARGTTTCRAASSTSSRRTRSSATACGRPRGRATARRR